MRYLKASIICGLLAFVLSVGLFALGVFRGLDAGLALFFGLSSPPAVTAPLQYGMMLIAAFGIAWTTIDIGRPALKFAVAAVALAECVGAVWVASLFGFYFSPFATITATGLAFLFGFIYSQTSAGRRKETLNQLLGERVSKETFRKLLECDIPLKFEGEIRDATVVVCEVFNHQDLLTRMRTNDYVAMMNSFLKNCSDVLVEHGGYLDECDGECVRVVFGAPLPDLRHAARACDAALQLTARLDAVNHECHQVWGEKFDYRIGINSGAMVMAAYGSGRAGSFSVAGEPVEFARRLCAANTIYGSRILVGAISFNEAEDELEVRPMELVQRHADPTQREEVYELIAKRDTIQDADRERRELFWMGVIHFRSKQLDAALEKFEAAAAITGHDGPSEFYIDRIAGIRAGHSAPDWDSVRI